MFGYVKPFKPNLRMREFEMYKGVYCALCKCMGREYGLRSRLTLNYDFAFLALLMLSVQEDCAGFEKQRCFFNPLKKCWCCKKHEAFSFTAAASMLMFYHKVRADIRDKRFFASLPPRLLLPYAWHMRKKAKKRFPDTDERMERFVRLQNEIERQQCRSIDEAAHPSAQILSELCGVMTAEEQASRVLARLGYCVGRFVYLIDAADDMEKDLKSGGYNVFLLSRGITDPSEIDAVRPFARDVLLRTVREAATALDLLSVRRFGPILSNIINEGLPYAERQLAKTEVAQEV